MFLRLEFSNGTTLKMQQKILSTAQNAGYLFYVTLFYHITLSNNISVTVLFSTNSPAQITKQQ